MLVIVAETSWIKSKVNWGANPASLSLRSRTNATGSPDVNPASEGVGERSNVKKIASRTFTCNDRTLVILEVVADSPKEVIRSATKFLVIEVNTK